jgi:monooxygenase
VDLVARYVCRLLVYMRRNGYAVVTPRLPAESMALSPFFEMTSGYFERSRSALPRQGDRAPWRLHKYYFKDAALFRGSINADELEFRSVAALVSQAH